MGCKMGDALASETFHQLLKILRFLRQHNCQMQEQGIRPHDYSLLRFLHEHGAATVGQIGNYLYKSNSTVSALITQLEKAGYVQRARSKDDNRVVMVNLTPAGREIAVSTPLAGLPLLRQRLHTLPEEQLPPLNAALSEIMRLLEMPTEDQTRSSIRRNTQKL